MTSTPILPGLLVVLGIPWTPGSAQEQEPEKRPEAGPAVKPAVDLPEDFVRFARVPDGGIQPCLERGPDSLAVLYFKGDEAKGDLYLARSKDEARSFEPSVRLNATPGTVLTQECGHSGALALGQDGRAHVVWVAGDERPTLYHAREKPDGGLEAAHDLGSPERLGRSTALALDPSGAIRVFYAAQDTEPGDGPAGLRIWMRTSDDGASFGAPIAIDSKPDGVLESSALAARVDRHKGTVFVFYLTAGRRGWPEVRLLSSVDAGASFASKVIEFAIKRANLPHSRPSLSQELQAGSTVGEPPTILSWDTYGRVFWSVIDPRTKKLPGSAVPLEPYFDKTARRFRPAGAAQGKEYLLAWLEQPVGDRSVPPLLAWEVWYVDGTPQGWGKAPETRVTSAPAVFANQTRGFTILY